MVAGGEAPRSPMRIGNVAVMPRKHSYYLQYYQPQNSADFIFDFAPLPVPHNSLDVCSTHSPLQSPFWKTFPI